MNIHIPGYNHNNWIGIKELYFYCLIKEKVFQLCQIFFFLSILLTDISQITKTKLLVNIITLHADFQRSRETIRMDRHFANKKFSILSLVYIAVNENKIYLLQLIRGPPARSSIINEQIRHRNFSSNKILLIFLFSLDLCLLHLKEGKTTKWSFVFGLSRKKSNCVLFL